MKSKIMTTFLASNKTAIFIGALTCILISIMPSTGYAALCANETKSTAYYDGYAAAESDSHAGHGQNQNVTGSSSQYSQDYKQGYRDGWNDAQYNVNVIQSGIC